jgi:hypothetical protein
VFPGHYAGRTPHIHILAHQNATVFKNGTINSGNSTHVGQFFMDQTLISEVSTTSPYASNTQALTTNEEDSILAQEAGTIDPMLEYVLLGDTVADGLMMWAAMGIDTTAEYSVSPAAFLTPNGGVVNANAGSGGAGGAPPGGSGAPGGPVGTSPASSGSSVSVTDSSATPTASSSAAVLGVSPGACIIRFYFLARLTFWDRDYLVLGLFLLYALHDRKVDHVMSSNCLYHMRIRRNDILRLWLYLNSSYSNKCYEPIQSTLPTSNIQDPTLPHIRQQ